MENQTEVKAMVPAIGQYVDVPEFHRRCRIQNVDWRFGKPYRVLIRPARLARLMWYPIKHIPALKEDKPRDYYLASL